jgi:ComF family protein
MSILDLVFPKTCLGCGRDGKYLCSDCITKALPAKPLCPYCMRPSVKGVTHTECQNKYSLDGLISIWKYQGAIRKAITSLKYKYSTEVGRELTECFTNVLKINNSTFMIPNSSILVPIPLHWHKENVRGFNQSIEVGGSVSSVMGWKFIPDLLVKKQSTVSQTELGGEARRQNLKNVFSINPAHKSTSLNLKYVILFDDVFTSGSTLREAAKVLKRAGVEKVWGLTIAR